MHTRLGERLKGLAALVGLVAVLAGPPLALARLVGWPLPRSVPTLDGISMSLQGGVADEVVVNVLAVLAWLVWIQIAAAAVAELAALARGHKASRAPVVAGVQIGVAKLVAACALLAGVAAQRSAPAAPPRMIAVVRPAPRAPAQAEVPPRLQAVVAAPVAAGPAAGYTVRRGDSWWAIAEAQLGDGQRWKELRAANAGRTMPDGEVVGASTDDIRPGWTLVVPGTPPAAVANATTADVVVRRGDSLWSITQDHLAAEEGHRAAETDVRRRWAEVIDLNRDRLADPANPNLIFAGQVLRFPGGAGVASIPPAAVAAAPAPPAPPPPAPVVQPSPPAPEQATVPATVAAPEPVAVPVREPRSPAPDPHAEVTEPTDRHRAVPTGLLGTAGTMLAVGVGMSLTRRRRRRLSELPPRAIEPPAPAELDDLRAEVCRRADTDHADRLHCALRDVARAVGEARSEARPRLVQVSPKRVEVLLSRAVVPAPKRWRAEASGNAWSLAGEPADTDVDGPATAPTLVSVGRPDASTEVYLDLETEGVVSLVGDDDLVVDVARSWALELAMSPLAAGVTVKLVGDLAGLAPDEGRIFTAGSWSEVAADATAWVQQTSALVAAHRWASPFAGRVGEHNDGLSPLVLVGRPSDDEVFASLCRLVLETEAVVVIVAVGGEVEGATAVEVTTAGLSIPDVGLRCEPQAVTAESAHHVEELLDDATVVPDQLSFLPDRPPPPVKIGAEADVYRDPPFEVLVRVLGDIEVVGGKRKLTPQETAVVAYLALHSPASAAQVADSIWSAPTESRQKSLTNVLYQCRGALGPLNVPKCDQDGRYKVGPGLVTDLELFRRRATYAAGQAPEDAVATLRGALELATGPVFTSRPAERSSFVWVDVEYWMSHTELAVTDTAEDLVGRYRDLDDMDGAIWAARQGLLVCRTHARLTKLLMEAYLANGDALAARRVYESHQTALEKMDIDGVDNEGLFDVYRKAAAGQDQAG